MRNLWRGALLLLMAGACTNEDFVTEEVNVSAGMLETQSATRSIGEVLQIAENATRLLMGPQTRAVGRTIDPMATQY